MGLEDLKEELKTQIAEAEKNEGLVVEEEKVEREEPKADEQPKEEPKVEEAKKEEPEKVKTPSDYAAERHKEKAKLLADQLALANARIADLEKPKVETVVNSDPEPDRAADPQAHLEWKLRRTEEKLTKTEAKLERVDQRTTEQERQKQSENLRSQAEQEVQNYEIAVRQQAPDYDDVKRYYANMIAASIKIVNPKITNDKLIKVVNDRLLLRASELLNDGHENPIAVMYQEAKALGYQPPAKASNDEGTVVKPDLTKVAANRARNAGTAAAQGDNGRGELTPKVAATLTNKEFAKLKPEEKKRLFSQLQGVG